MKKILTSAIAIGSAMTLAMISAAQVFALDENALQDGIFNEQAIAEQQFVNSFSDETTREVAEYYLNGGLSLEETADIMKTYEEGLEQMSISTRASVSSPYYNTSKLCGTKHYAAAIIVDPTEDVGEIFSLTFNNTILSCAKSDISICLPYTGSECETTMQNIIKQVKTNTTIKTTVMANAPEKATVAEGIVRYNFKITNKNSITSESDFRDAIQFNPISGSSVAMETYALGDVDHNGVIDAQDQTYLSQFLVGKIDGFNFTYSDGSNHYSFATNGLAADTNQDDVVDMLDAIQLNKYIAGQSNTLVD